MKAFEICYRENGLFKIRGFKYEEDFNKFVARMMKKSNVQLIQSCDNTRGITTNY